MTIHLRLAHMLLAAICTLAAGSLEAQVVDPSFAGRYGGSVTVVPTVNPLAGSGTMTAELDTEGNFTASIASSNGADGCTFSTNALLSRFVSGAGVLVATGYGQMIGCASAEFASLGSVDISIQTLGGVPQLSITLSPYSPNNYSVVAIEGLIPKVGAEATGAASREHSSMAGMWYSPTESGWGLSITVGGFPGQVPFIVLNTYVGSQPTWFVMTRGTWSSATVLSGDLYSASGVDYRESVFDPARVVMRKVGSLKITFSRGVSSAPTAVLNYSIAQPDGTTFEATKSIAKQLF